MHIISVSLVYLFIFQKKEWLCLNCQTQRLMSGGLDDTPLHAPYPSPKHQQVSSPRHHALASQQEGPSAMLRQQKTPTTDGAAPVAATVVKLAGDTKPLSQFSSTSTTCKAVGESHKKDQTMPKLVNEQEHISGVTEEPKPIYKKGTSEPIVTTTTKDEKRDSQRSRYYEVILYFIALLNGATFLDSPIFKNILALRSSTLCHYLFLVFS